MHPDYCVLLDPALEITSADLAAAWKEIPECAQAGDCALGKGSGFTIDLADASTLALITFGSTLAKDLVMELVKQAVARANTRLASKHEVVVEQIPDAATGLPILRVTRKS